MDKKLRFLFLTCATLIVVLLVAGVFVEQGRADVGIPPWAFPGTSLDPGETSTRVQMVSEQVLMNVEAAQRGDLFPNDGPQLSARRMVGHVEAVFNMRNQGDASEAFDVWFPVWLPDYPYYAPTAGVENFSAWVDGNPVQVAYYQESTQDMQSPRPWATWKVDFPPGQDVQIRVGYDTFPEGNLPYGTFHYILETGADWWGPIGEATITIRLPYEVNETNTALNPDSKDIFGPSGANPIGFTVSGNEVSWHFADLEPTAAENVRLTVMDPPVWEEIAAAREAVAANPGSASAQLDLANASFSGLELFKSSYLKQADSARLAEDASAAYQRAVELSPETIPVGDLVKSLKLLFWGGTYQIDSVPPNLLALLNAALDRSPAETKAVSGYLAILYAQWDSRYYNNLEAAPRPSPELLALLDKVNTLTGGELDWLAEEWANLEPLPAPTLTPTLTATQAPAPSSSPTAPLSSLTPVEQSQVIPTSTSQEPTEPASTSTVPLPDPTGTSRTYPYFLLVIPLGVVIIVVLWLSRRNR